MLYNNCKQDGGTYTMTAYNTFINHLLFSSIVYLLIYSIIHSKLDTRSNPINLIHEVIQNIIKLLYNVDYSSRWSPYMERTCERTTLRNAISISYMPSKFGSKKQLTGPSKYSSGPWHHLLFKILPFLDSPYWSYRLYQFLTKIWLLLHQIVKFINK